MDVHLLFFTYPVEKIVARVDRSKAEMLSADTLLRNWRILKSWSGGGVVIISDTDNFSDINDNTFICGISTWWPFTSKILNLYYNAIM